MTSISIRNAVFGDVETVAIFVHALLDELTGGQPPAIDVVAAHAADVLSGTGVIALVAFVGSEPVGVMTLNECAAIYAGGRFGEISELYVRPEHRSQGVAGQLLEHASQEARERGWKRLEVGAPSQPEWHRTLRFYLSNGFDEVGPRLRRLI